MISFLRLLPHYSESIYINSGLGLQHLFEESKLGTFPSTMENSNDDPIFSTQRSAPVLHTPMSFRARHRIHFAAVTTDSTSSASQEPSTNSPVVIQTSDSGSQEQNAARLNRVCLRVFVANGPCVLVACLFVCASCATA